MLKIYDVLSQEVKTLVNEGQDAGYYSVVWDGRNEQGFSVASGIYLYRFVAGEYIEVKKMVVSK